MLRIFTFIFMCISQFIAMLFTIDIGDGLNLGLLMCIIFIFLPLILFIINLIKHIAISDMVSDYKYDRRQQQKQRKRGN